MTIIVAIADGSKVFMGSDSGSSDKDFITASLTPKIRVNNEYIIGYAGSRGTGQLLHYLEYPVATTENLEQFMRFNFVRVAKQACEDLSTDTSDSDKASADLLVGVHGRVFEISTEDWSVTEYSEIATGSGYQYALGSLHTTQGKPARSRVLQAVNSAIYYSTTCAEPANVMWV
jgi:ATP-dependent protease HslVU (ClpYQ) peptidase subunit